MDLISFMIAPLAATLILGGILVYFGIHVIKREIIFIDIALAQIAALGGTLAIVLWPHNHNAIDHAEGHQFLEYGFSLLFTTLAAGLFSIFKNKKIRIPLEALIGISYAVATTAMVIILDKGTGGDVHIHDMLTGAILWVGWPEVIRLGIVVAAVALFHWIFRAKFMNLTDNYDNCDYLPAKRKLWDFLFYFSFGLVIVEAVQVGGILTVFALLIIPASTTLLFFSSWKSRILAGLLLSLILTIPALWVSWTWDLPASPVLIMFLGITLIGGGIVYQIKKRRSYE